MLTEATKANLRRKSFYVDNVQMHEAVPLFSWIDINLTELCNRMCVFCPRADVELYPNQKLHMGLPLIKKISDELRGLNYEGAVVLCGFGEPLLHPQIIEIASCFGGDIRLEIVTNGDHLTPELINALLTAGVHYIVVSMYDGPHQVGHFTGMFEKAGCTREHYILRDRWHTHEDNFGLKLTNRAGTVSIGSQDAVDVTKPCHYPVYSMTLDWNGDVLLCVQDWNKKVKLGNVYAQSLLDVWKSKALNKIRARLAAGRRNSPPCNRCNADGTLHGFNHITAWKLQTTERPVILVSDSETAP